MRIKILFDFNGNVQGKAIHFKKGDVVDVNDADALLFIDGLQAVGADTPEVETAPKKARKTMTKEEAEIWQPDEL